MKTKTLNVIILVLLCAGFIGNILLYFEVIPQNFIIAFIAAIGQIAGLVVLILNGKTLKNKFYFRLISIFTIVILISMIFKIVKIPGNDILFLFGIIGIFLGYLFHFLTIKGKSTLDIFKLIWSFLFLTSLSLIILHIPFGQEIKLLEVVLFIVMYGLYMKQLQSETKK